MAIVQRQILEQAVAYARQAPPLAPERVLTYKVQSGRTSATTAALVGATAVTVMDFYRVDMHSCTADTSGQAHRQDLSGYLTP